ncbi:DUF2249 domain-containing protein [Ornithinimicrobium sp. INDO-MA30-4]|uniref:DUF2249 domain-containing protein n=1 Tax=Ornithinimicrobium sp. INDO-MA30-4 TaxID=2908651 RepID=UPI001F48F3B6|nr:DUF2249 domain-containing protein [Ornithinimicrobium sp. INDO-MA30-4]UJH69375.1 DUF2249 domain-containing protein [Ornithinimicrobium sp. INDO-MA30-4]
MNTDETAPHSAQRLDVRPMRKPDKHPAIFAAYAALPAGGSFVLINDHDPKHLRDEFEMEHPGSYGWEYLNQEPRDWRIRISKASSAPLPRVLVNTNDLTGAAATPDMTGAAWKLQVRERDLDSNIIALPPQGRIDAHTGPDLDVLIYVLVGQGRLTTELGDVELSPGDLVFLPRRSRREFTAGGDGLRYLTVHQRKQGLVIGSGPPRS